MLAMSATLGCGMSLCLAFWTSESQAAKLPPAQIHHVQGWTMVIQPGPVKARPTPSPAAEDSASPKIRLASFSGQTDPEMPPLPEHLPEGTIRVAPGSANQQPCSPESSGATVDQVRRYRQVYDAIPFSRAEYDANPSYRHDATMEFLFGQLRPMVIHRGHTTVSVQQSDAGGFEWSPYVYYGLSGWYGPMPAPGFRVYRGW